MEKRFSGQKSIERSISFRTICFISNDLFHFERSISCRTIYFRYQRHEAYQLAPMHGEDRWVIEVDISSNIWQAGEWCKGYLIRYLLHHPSAYQIFYEIFICTTCLPLRYSILNHLPACQIFALESPACLPDIRSWITCLPAKYSLLNHLPA